MDNIDELRSVEQTQRMNTSETHPPTTERIVENRYRQAVTEIATIVTVPMALRAAIKLDVPQILASAGRNSTLSSKDILARTGLECPNAGNLDRILRLLASRGVVSESIVEIDGGETESRYGLTPVSDFLVEDDDGTSLAPLILMQTDEIFMKSWQFLHEAVLTTAEPFTKAHGKTAFEYGKYDSGVNKLFNKAMDSHSKIFMRAVLEEYDGFQNVTRLVDVGGGIGSSLRLILSKYPHIEGVNFDQPHVVAQAPEYPGVEHLGGDMFESVPAGDCIFLKWILHDWDDKQCVKVLESCYRSLARDGKLVIADGLLRPAMAESSGADRHVLRVDLLMMSYNSGGKERSESEFRKLVTCAGFRDLHVIVTVDSLTVMEAYKRP